MVFPSQEVIAGRLAADSEDEKMDEIVSTTCASEPAPTTPAPKRPINSEICHQTDLIEMPKRRGRGRPGPQALENNFTSEARLQIQTIFEENLEVLEWKKQCEKQFLDLTSQVESCLTNLEEISKNFEQVSKLPKTVGKMQENAYEFAQNLQDLRINFSSSQTDQSSLNCSFADDLKVQAHKLLEMENKETDAVIIFSINIFKIFKCFGKHI